jgi:AcrR family transcriptional regulator
MSYEVVKTIRGRDYRYLVESYRDPQTGKVRNRWRYLGKAGGDSAPRRRGRAEETRTKLTLALEAMLERKPWSAITAHGIAEQAKVAPATLYRYFSSRDDIMQAVAARANSKLDARLAELARLARDRESERARLRAWVIAMAKNSLAIAMPAHERRAQRRRAFERYFELIAAHGYATIPHAQRAGLALALSQIVAGQVLLRDDEYAALATAVERLIFV